MLPSTDIMPGRRGHRDAAPVAFIHGLLESTAIWNHALPETAASGHDSVALPLPAHHPWTLAGAEAERALAGERVFREYRVFLERHFGGRPVRLVGHSTGALMAIELAHRFPHLVDGVFAVAALSGRLRGWNRWMTALLLSIPVLGDQSFGYRLRDWLADDERFLRGIQSVVSRPIGPPGWLAEMREDLRKCDPGGLRRLVLWLSRQDIGPRLETTPVPIRFLICANDPVVPAAQQLEMVNRSPNCDAVLLDTGHLPMIERPDLFAELLRLWLRHQTRLADLDDGLPIVAA